MKEQEEKELSGEAAPPAEDAAAVKPSEETNGEGDEEAAAAALGAAAAVDDVAACDLPGPDGGSSGGGGNDINSGLQGKETQACETAQGALGQVKAKVEVCKDESIGECLLPDAARWAALALQDLTCVIIAIIYSCASLTHSTMNK